MTEGPPRGRDPEGPLRRRGGERIRLEHESTLSLDWGTHHGGNSQADEVEETLRALRDSYDEHEIGSEPEPTTDRTMRDPANMTLRGSESPLIAPKGTGRRVSDEGLRFSGASLSFGHVVVVEHHDLPHAVEADEDGDPGHEAAKPGKADLAMTAVGILLAIAGTLMLIL